MKRSYYQITCESNQNRFNVVVNHSTPLEDEIWVGGEKRCAMLLIDKVERTCHLQLLDYKKECNVLKNLKRDSGTISLLKSSILLVKYFYPYIARVSLEDESFIMCKNKQRFSLGVFYLAKYGETWYQKKLGARCTKDITNMIVKINTFMHSRPKLESLIADEELIKYLDKKYENCSNLRELMFEVNECSYFSGWLDKIIIGLMPNKKYPTSWYIDVNQGFDKFNITVAKVRDQPHPRMR